MCVIIDNNVAQFLVCEPNNRHKAETKLLEYIDKGKLKLVIGGRLKNELCESPKVKIWISERINSGKAKDVPKKAVEAREKLLLQKNNLSSNDPHVLALALESGARLLYSHDVKLGHDFKDTNIIPNPRGKVYKTNNTDNFTSAHQKLLDNASCLTS